MDSMLISVDQTKTQIPIYYIEVNTGILTGSDPVVIVSSCIPFRISTLAQVQAARKSLSVWEGIGIERVTPAEKIDGFDT